MIFHPDHIATLAACGFTEEKISTSDRMTLRLDGCLFSAVPYDGQSLQAPDAGPLIWLAELSKSKMSDCYVDSIEEIQEFINEQISLPKP